MSHGGARELLEQLKHIIGELRGVQQRGINKTCKNACHVLIRALEIERDCGVELLQQVAAAGSDATNLPQFEDTLRQVLDIAQDAKQLLPKCRQRPFPTFSMKANKQDLLRLAERLSKILLNPLQASHDIRIHDHIPRSFTTLQLNDKFIALSFVNHPNSSSSLWLSFHLNLHVYDTHTTPYQCSWSGSWQRPATVVAVSRSGEIWTGHQKGLVGVHHHNGITTPAQLLPSRVTAIAFDEDEAGGTCTAWVCDDLGNVRLCSCDERGITVATSIALADGKYQYGGGRETLGGAVNAIVVHRNRALMATGGSSPSLLLWSTRKGMQHSAVDVVKLHGGEVKHIAVIPSKGTTASWLHHFFIVTADSTASDGPPLTIWCVEDSSVTEVAHYKADLPDPPLPPICGLHIFTKVGIMATVHDDSVLAIWPLPTHAYQLARRASSASATATQTFTPRVCRIKLKDKARIVASTADASRLAVAWMDGIVRTWDATWLRNRAELDNVDFSKADLATHTSSRAASTSSGGAMSLGVTMASSSRRGLLSGLLTASFRDGVGGRRPMDLGVSASFGDWEGGRWSSDDLEGSASSSVLSAAWRAGAAAGMDKRGSETMERLVESQYKEGGGLGGPAGLGRRMSVEAPSKCPIIQPQNLQFVQTIGSGPFTEVQLANYQYTQVAVRTFKVPEGATADKEREMLLALDMEVQMLHSLVYVKNCIRLLGWCQDPPMIITDYYPKGSLFHNLKGIRDKHEDMADSQLKHWMVRLDVAKGIAAGMQQMHAKEPPIIHGDLRSPNIFLTSSYEPRIGGFGLAKRDNSPNSTQTWLTNARYAAPELYTTHELTTATDVYAYGVILWELLTFKIPYEETNTVFIANKDAPHHPEIPDTTDPLPFPPDSGFLAYRALLSRCFALNPAERLSFRQIAHQLSNVINKAKMSLAVAKITTSEAEQRLQPRMRSLVNTVIAVHRSTMAESSQSTLAATQSGLYASPPAASFLPAATCPICSRTQALCTCHSALVHADSSSQLARPPRKDDLIPSSQIMGISNARSLAQAPSGPFVTPPSTSTPTTSAAGQVPSPFAAPPPTSTPTTSTAGQVPSPFVTPPPTSTPTTSAAGQVPSPFAARPPTSTPTSSTAGQVPSPSAAPSSTSRPTASAAGQVSGPFAVPPPTSTPTASAAGQVSSPFAAPPPTSTPTTSTAGQVSSPFAAPPPTSTPTTSAAGQVPSPLVAPSSTSTPTASAAGQQLSSVMHKVKTLQAVTNITGSDTGQRGTSQSNQAAPEAPLADLPDKHSILRPPAEAASTHVRQHAQQVASASAGLPASADQSPFSASFELPDVLVGLTTEELEPLLRIVGDARMLVLHGMGGVGKSILAKKLFNAWHEADPTALCHFVPFDAEHSNITEAQAALMSGVSFSRHVEVTDEAEGRKQLYEALQGKLVLLLVDNVGTVHLEQLLPHDVLNCVAPGSRILVTSREDGRIVAWRFGGTAIQHEVLCLPQVVAVELLCRQAFRQATAPAGEERLVDCLVQRCDGLPMALEVVGRHLAQMTVRQRQRFLLRLEEGLLEAYSLQLSWRQETLFEMINTQWMELSDAEKMALLDVAWLLDAAQGQDDQGLQAHKGGGQAGAREPTASSGGLPWEDLQFFYGEVEGPAVLDSLLKKNMVKRRLGAEQAQEVAMHSVIQDFCKLGLRQYGRERLVLNKSKAGGRSLEQVLTKVPNAQAMTLHSWELDSNSLELLSNMKMLRLLWWQRAQPAVPQLRSTSARLRWLLLEADPATSAALELQSMPSLVVLEVKSLNELRLRQCGALRSLSVSSCPHMAELDLGGLTALRRLQLSNCTQLQDVVGVGTLSSLTALSISACDRLCPAGAWQGSGVRAHLATLVGKAEEPDDAAARNDVAEPAADDLCDASDALSPEQEPGEELEELFHTSRAFVEQAVMSRSDVFDDATQLRLYGLYKQATAGPCDAPKPYPRDDKGEAKWSAWHALGAMCAEEAKIQYVELVRQAGATVNWHNLSLDGATPLHGAAGANMHRDVVRPLLKAGTDVAAKDKVAAWAPHPVPTAAPVQHPHMHKLQGQPHAQPHPQPSTTAAAPAPPPAVVVTHQQYPFMVRLPARYEVKERLGEGRFGLVLKAYDRHDGEHVAIKVLHPNNNYGSKYVEDELVHHSQLAEHPHIIRYKEVFLDLEGQLCLAMEYADGGTLLQYINQRHHLDEGLARWFFQQLIFAVTYCHKRHIAVRDIKLENILLAFYPAPDPAFPERCWLLKLCDFGFAKSYESLNVMRSRVGMPAYMAPEVIRASSRSDYNGMAADLWSCGVVLFTMLYGKFPFDYNYGHGHGDSNEYLRQLLYYMAHQELRAPDNVLVTDECYRFLLGLLHPDPTKRLTLQRINGHPWFRHGLPQQYLEYYDDPDTIQQEAVQDPREIQRLLQQAQHYMLQRYTAQQEAVQDPPAVQRLLQQAQHDD